MTPSHRFIFASKAVGFIRSCDLKGFRMTLAVHRLAGAAAAIVAGGTIILGSVFLISKSYNLPAYIAASRPAASIFYVKTYPLKPGRTNQPNCGIWDGRTSDGKSISGTVPCDGPPAKRK
jgi:hypothetical protein